MILGFFQLYRFAPSYTFGSFATAAQYDMVFTNRFKAHVKLDCIRVLHLGDIRVNWSGRKAPVWR